MRALLGVVGVVVVLGCGGEDEPRARRALDGGPLVRLAPTPIPIPLPDASTMARIEIDGPPIGTQVYGPRGMIGLAPGVFMFEPSYGPVMLRFEAPGHESTVLEVMPGRDTKVQIELKAAVVIPEPPVIDEPTDLEELLTQELGWIAEDCFDDTGVTYALMTATVTAKVKDGLLTVTKAKYKYKNGKGDKSAVKCMDDEALTVELDVNAPDVKAKKLTLQLDPF